MQHKESTKVSQNSLFLILQNWLQYNRRMLTIIEGKSLTGIPRGPKVPVVGRIKLSEICNMDQSPLHSNTLKDAHTQSGGTELSESSEGKSGHDKRQCTLQIAVFADGVLRCKPLLIFKGKPGKGDSRRKAEYKKYHPGVVVIFNKKAWANTSNLLDWLRISTPLPLHIPSEITNLDSWLLILSHHTKIRGRSRRRGQNLRRAKLCRLAEEKLQQELRDTFANLKVTLSLIPSGCTGYVQVLDVLVNKLIKGYIEEYEDLWIEEHFEIWQSSKWLVGDRRIPLLIG